MGKNRKHINKIANQIATGMMMNKDTLVIYGSKWYIQNISFFVTEPNIDISIALRNVCHPTTTSFQKHIGPVEFLNVWLENQEESLL